jgi:putative flippase GtrA
LRQIVVFGLVGGASAATYAATQTLAIEIAGIPVLAAALLAFAAGTLVSWIGNSRATFRVPLSARTAWRFGVVTGIGMLLNLGIVALIDALGGHYALGIAAVLATVPAFNFLGHRLWTFQEPSR